jgi:hypothetical protein
LNIGWSTDGETFSSLSIGSGYTEIVASGKNNKLHFSREIQSEAAQQFQFNSGLAGTTLKPYFLPAR